MRHQVNSSANVRTRGGKPPYPQNPRASVDVTIPGVRASFNPAEAHALGVDLTEAATFAMREACRIEGRKEHATASYAELRDFAQLVARMFAGGEVMPDGETFEHTGDDAVRTLEDLIATARLLTGTPAPPKANA